MKATFWKMMIASLLIFTSINTYAAVDLKMPDFSNLRPNNEIRNNIMRNFHESAALARARAEAELVKQQAEIARLQALQMRREMQLQEIRRQNASSEK
jgi:hypothetical protein